MRIVVGFFVTLFLADLAGAQETPVAPDATGNMRVVCQHKSDVRTLTYLEGSRQIASSGASFAKCQVVYRKYNKSNVVARSDYQIKLCQRIFDQIRGNLVKSGFTCQ